jgi:hypothetical protein
MYVNRTVFAQRNGMASVYCRAKQQICVLSDVMTTLYLRTPKATRGDYGFRTRQSVCLNGLSALRCSSHMNMKDRPSCEISNTHTQNRHISVLCAAAFCQQWRKFVDI